MSLHRSVLVECDAIDGRTPCRVSIGAGTTSAADTRELAETEGWYVSQGAEGPDFCPKHLPPWDRRR